MSVDESIAQDNIGFVGKQKITRDMLDYQVRIERTYGNDSIRPHMALVQLLRFALEEEAGIELNSPIHSEDLRQYRHYVDRSTRDPERLALIKSIFGPDTNAYEQYFLRPKLRNQVNRSSYYSSTDIHGQSLDTIQRAYNLTRIMHDFEEVARVSGASYQQMRLYPESMPEEYLAPEDKVSDHFNSVLFPLAQPLRNGEIHSHIIDAYSTYWIIRSLGSQPDGCILVEGLSVSKASFDYFLDRIASDLVVRITDPDLLRLMQTDYPRLSWVRSAIQG